MYNGRNLDELKMTLLTNWQLEELSYHHYMMSQMAPYMNHEGTRLHVELIKEMEKRGGLQEDLQNYYFQLISRSFWVHLHLDKILWWCFYFSLIYLCGRNCVRFYRQFARPHSNSDHDRFI
jgi:hypothetical protein